MKLPQLTIRDFSWLVLVAGTFGSLYGEEKPRRSDAMPRFASTQRIRGSRQTIEFLEWSKSRYALFAEVELDKAGNATTLGLHPCVSITDDDVKQIRKLTSLESLVADGAKLTDTGMAALAEMKSLKKVWIVEAKQVTDEAIEKIRKARPCLELEMPYRD